MEEKKTISYMRTYIYVLKTHTYIQIRHLQGYYVIARDEAHYVYLMTDAMFYNLEKLRKRLRMNYMINVGGKVFRLNRDLLETRDTPNFFTSIG